MKHKAHVLVTSVFVFSLVLSALIPAGVQAGIRAEYAPDSFFTDLHPGDEGFYALTALRAVGIVQGHGDGSVRPEERLTRAAFARMVVTLMQDEALASRLQNGGSFRDAPEWARGSLAALRHRTLVQWTGGAGETVRKDEAIAALMRLLGHEWESREKLFDSAVNVGLVRTAPKDPGAELTRDAAADLLHACLVALTGPDATQARGDAQEFARAHIVTGELTRVENEWAEIADEEVEMVPDVMTVNDEEPGDLLGRSVRAYRDEDGRIVMLAPTDVDDDAGAVAVLTYHHIVAGEATSAMEISQRDFVHQLEYMMEEGYEFLSLDEFSQAHREGEFPDQAVLLTFDDGYRSFYEYAYPVLREHEIPAVIFPIVSYRPGLTEVETNYPHMTFREIRNVVKDGDLYDVGSHTYDLHYWREDGAAITPEPEEDAESYSERIERDLRRSRDFLRMQTDRPVKSLAWPYGIATSSAIEIADEVGFELLFTTVPKTVTPDTCLQAIPRYSISVGDTEQLGQLLREAFSQGTEGDGAKDAR